MFGEEVTPLMSILWRSWFSESGQTVQLFERFLNSTTSTSLFLLNFAFLGRFTWLDNLEC